MSRCVIARLFTLFAFAALPWSAAAQPSPAVAVPAQAPGPEPFATPVRPAQTAPTPRPDAAPPRPTGQATPAVPATVRSQDARTAWNGEGRPMGFSVVLVAGDLRAAGGGEDDVPPAARKALADMRDFLPYKSYRLLDAAWVLCCGPGRTTTRLRGPEDREYELEIVATSGPSSRNAITFVLRDASAVAAEDLAEANARVQDLQRHLEVAEKAAQADKASANAKAAAETAEVRRRELIEQRRRVEQAQVRSRGRGSYTFSGTRPIINTSFAMDAGETVVVGTSRLSGGDQALIALLTAVPQKGASRTP
jgi:hypothetical protein